MEASLTRGDSSASADTNTCTASANSTNDGTVSRTPNRNRRKLPANSRSKREGKEVGLENKGKLTCRGNLVSGAGTRHWNGQVVIVAGGERNKGPGWNLKEGGGKGAGEGRGTRGHVPRCGGDSRSDWDVAL